MARLTDGREIYPHRDDLYEFPYWICDACNGYVGCHHKTKNRTKPLGCIPSPEIKNARQHIHRILDPMWKDKKEGWRVRNQIYNKLSDVVGRRYHTAELRTLEECRKVYAELSKMRGKYGG